MEVYNEEYSEQMNEVFPKWILERFKDLHNSQKFSWRVKSSLFDGISEKKLTESMILLANEFGDLLRRAFSHYRPYWEKINSDLISAREMLEENKNQLEELLAKTSSLLQIPWRTEKLHIQLVDPFTGEPVGENVIALGIGLTASLPSEELVTISFFFILHEATHILVWDTIRKTAANYATEEHAEYVDEAVMNLIRGSLFKQNPELQKKFQKTMQAAVKLAPPSYIGTPRTPEGRIWKARHEKRNHHIGYYRELFQDDWEELLGGRESLSEVIEILLERNREKIEK